MCNFSPIFFKLISVFSGLGLIFKSAGCDRKACRQAYRVIK